MSVITWFGFMASWLQLLRKCEPRAVPMYRPVPPRSPRPRSAPRRARIHRSEEKFGETNGVPKGSLPGSPRGSLPRGFSARPGRRDKIESRTREESKEDQLAPLMKAIAGLCQHRDRGFDLWFWLLEPLRHLVLCEEVKIVVRCLGPLPPDPQLPFSHDAEASLLKTKGQHDFIINMIKGFSHDLLFHLFI